MGDKIIEEKRERHIYGEKENRVRMTKGRKEKGKSQTQTKAVFLNPSKKENRNF